MKKIGLTLFIGCTFTLLFFIDCTLAAPNQSILTAASLPAQIDRLLAKYYQMNEPGAAVIVIKNESVVFRKAYGMADLQLSVRLQPEMVFKLGSTTKQFTAVAIMLLVEQGKLALDDPLTKFLPDFPFPGNRITIRQLLTHTSGLDDYIAYDRIRDDLTVDELILCFRDRELVAEPGEQWQYSNPGYVLLGKIIEVVSGQSYAEFLQEHLFQPLKMHNTFYGENHRIIPGLVTGYRKHENSYQNAPYMSMTHPYAAGALLSNVDDLARWHTGLVRGKLLRRKSLHQCFAAQHLSNGEVIDYGLGWFINTFKGRKNINHGGGVFGFVNHTMYLPEEEVYVALLSNRINPRAVPGTQGITEMVAALAIGDPVEIKEYTPISLGVTELQKYAGVYQLDSGNGKDSGNIRQIIVEEQRIFFGLYQERRIEIFPASPTVFFIPGVAGSFTFAFDRDSSVTHFTQQRGNGTEQTWVKKLQ
jgi:CubicO group peptidase (beta-lactamase class C family)